MRPICNAVFCKKCISDRVEVMTDDLSTEMGHMMCNTHFYEYLEQQQQDAVNVMIHRQFPFARQLAFSPGNYAAALEK